MVLKVIGAGFGRTASLSLTEALEQLGFTKCFRMEDLFKNPSHNNYVTDDKDVDWDTLFEGCEAAVDWSFTFFYKQLMEQYPDVKIILNSRGQEKWYQSALEIFHNGSESNSENDGTLHAVFEEVIWNEIFGGQFLDQEYAVKVFERHIAEMEKQVPADKLLIFDVQDGWEPLGKFLKVGIPEAPFPHMRTLQPEKKRLDGVQNGLDIKENMAFSRRLDDSTLTSSLEQCAIGQVEEDAPTDGAHEGIHIIGAGFGRTGTLSLKTALERLGYMKCYHMKEAVEKPNDLGLFVDVMNGKDVDWDALFRGYKATVDWPGCTFYKKLMMKYPQAKVILSVRDPDRWYQSSYDTIYEAGKIKVIANMPVTRRIDDLVWKGTFHGQFEDKKHAIEVFEKHNEEVKAYVPPEKLLVFSVKDGWEPLCKFLGKPIPDEPFPHLNDREVFRNMIRVLSEVEQK